jgi:hypothetical protein
MKRSKPQVTSVEVQVIAPNPALKQLEISAAILDALRQGQDLGQVPISSAPRIRQLLSQIETDITIIRKTTVGNGR